MIQSYINIVNNPNAIALATLIYELPHVDSIHWFPADSKFYSKLEGNFQIEELDAQGLVVFFIVLESNPADPARKILQFKQTLPSSMWDNPDNHAAVIADIITKIDSMYDTGTIQWSDYNIAPAFVGTFTEFTTATDLSTLTHIETTSTFY